MEQKEEKEVYSELNSQCQKSFNLGPRDSTKVQVLALHLILPSLIPWHDTQKRERGRGVGAKEREKNKKGESEKGKKEGIEKERGKNLETEKISAT